MDGLEQDILGNMADGSAVKRFVFANRTGSRMSVIALGATVTELWMPDRDGALRDVVLGFDSVPEYEANPPYFGCTVGRVANRIANARFELDGQTYELAPNLPPHHLHGGVRGFHQALWEAEPAERDSGPAVRFSHVSPDGEEGYPGELTVQVLYQLTDDNSLRIEYEAICNRPTPVNLTNHSYFNLRGHDRGSILDHTVRIDAETYTHPDGVGVPTGEIRSLDGSPLDFRVALPVGARIEQVLGGYDHNYVLASGDDVTIEPRVVSEVVDPSSGRRMILRTTEPGVQFYTGNFLDCSGKGGASYERHCALCLETQHFPDAINKPHFPSVVLRPGEVYRQVTEYEFSTS